MKYQRNPIYTEADKYRGINGICLKCLNMKLATGRKAFCACKEGRLQCVERMSCTEFAEAK
jgi:hypothetical protein